MDCRSIVRQVFLEVGLIICGFLRTQRNFLNLFDPSPCPHATAYKHLISLPFIPPYPIHNWKKDWKSLIHRCFSKKNDEKRYKYIVVGREKTYFVKHRSESKNKYTEEEVIQMLEFFIDNIFVQFGGLVFQQTIGIPMGTNCAPLLADLFLHSYEAEFIERLLKSNNKKLTVSFNLSFRYIDDVLSLNNSKFGDYVNVIYPKELEIKDTTDKPTRASYLDLLLEFDNRGRLFTKLFDKRDDFSFAIINFPFLCGNIPAAPAYGVYISQLVRYSRACGLYNDFLDRARILTNKLLRQGFVAERLKSSLQKFFGRHHELVDRYETSVAQMRTDLFP